MQIIFGIIFHFIGGFASGSFYVPYKKVKGWHWENYWLVGGLFSWLIIPPLAAWITVPNFTQIIAQTSASIFWWTYFWGILWGVGGLMYGLGMRYLGMSLGNSVLLGFTSAFGALVPSIYYNFHPEPGKTTLHDLLTTSWGRIVLIGIIICLIGIVICGRAGVLKEKELSEEKKKESIKEFSLVKGLIVCIISGILSACFNYGIEAGSAMADAANAIWKAAHPLETVNFLYRNNVIYIVLLWGGLTTNFIWCILLNARNKTFCDYTDKKTPLARNYFFAAL
ncbi:MAG: L-rhamnose/proton symporter RhaT, partial [Parafilimonas sp.]